MEFRPCIDIHEGRVKQIVGGSLEDGKGASENFVSDRDADYYAGLYRARGLAGGHIILLDKAGTKSYDKDLEQAEKALATWPGALQVGGGITPENAEDFLDMGASHVIVTSYVFDGGKIRYDRLDEMKFVVGRNRLVLDLSVRLRDGAYYVVTDRWQKFTDEELTPSLITSLSYHCDEFLVHAVNVEGTGTGVDEELLRILARSSGNPITYAGGVSSFEDIETIREIGEGRIHFTIGSKLDLFGGHLAFEDVIDYCK
ncbi:MAG: phosphoribosylformimino-5-aminoimidazole carboxamide ribotide isomerase [Eubacterium sp.]|nr:phosphoribosylformimino-5-aminoimidazole carboxamide ribotide isomerase [Eubacterium sp.]